MLSNQPANSMLCVVVRPDHVPAIKDIFVANTEVPSQDLIKLLKTAHQFYKGGTAGVGIRECCCFGSQIQ